MAAGELGSLGGPTSIAVYVCTHRRNGPLATMLESLNVAAQQVQPEVEIAVVVVDDNPDGRAETVVEGFDHKFVRGLHYRHSGQENISVARNVGLEATLELADWVAMVDDDQTVTEGWFEALVAMQAATETDAVTGPVDLRYPPGTPSYLVDQPFEEYLEAESVPDGTKVGTCSTGNSMIRGSFLTDHPEIRFRPDLGTVGGEDMVFYKAAVAAGLDARYANDARCYHELPPERSTLGFHVRTSYWIGNTQYVTSYEAGEASRPWLTLRGGRQLATALARPVGRVMRGQSPQFAFTGAAVARAVGTLAGVVGIRAKHH